MSSPEKSSENLSYSESSAKLRTYLDQAKRVLISTHMLPDGDGLGAEAALFHYLKRAKKACRIYNPDLLPKRYRFLDPKNLILLGPGEVELWDTWDLWIILDTNDPRRLGKLWSELAFRTKKIVFLDHHPKIVGTEEIHYPPHSMVISDPSSSSIGELLFTLFQELDFAKINKEIALGLYVSVMTDTNSFRYSRTTPKAHQIAGEMIELGVNPEEVYQAIYSSKEVSHLQLLGNMLQNVRVGAGGKVAWLEMSLELRKKYQASADDTQSFLNLLLLIKDAEVVCLFREEDDGQVRVSMKSKGKIVINKLAMDLGGGGHEFAAGVAVSSTLPKTVTTVIKRLEALVNQFEKFKKMKHSLRITRFGGPEVLKLIEEPSSSLSSLEVRIQVTACGVNFADLMMRMGLYPESPKPPFVPGYEIAGKVTEIGNGVKSFHVGDRVLAGLRFGGYTSEVTLPELQVRKIPDGLTDIEAAAIPVNFMTAWVALQDMARVRKGDRVLIHSAAGGVGVAAVQIAAQAGAHVVGLVSSLAKSEAIKALGASEMLTYSEWETMRDQDAGGFQVILDSAGGKSLSRSFKRLAPAGRVITYGLSQAVSGQKRSLSTLLPLLFQTTLFTPFKLMMENKGVFGLNLLKVFEHPILVDSLDQILDRFKDGSFKVIVGKTFPLEEGGLAHDSLQSRTNVGKIVLIPSGS